MKHLLITCITLGLMSANGLAQATAKNTEAPRLGVELTPLGAIRAGNADGSIPAWQGSAGYPPASLRLSREQVNAIWARRQHEVESILLPDPGELRFRITPDQLPRFESQLTAGHIEMLRRYPDYTMPVFPTRRLAFVPEEVAEATMQNASRAKLIGTDTVEGARVGIPFPVPCSGAEAVWNHRLRYRGTSGAMHGTDLIVNTEGEVNMVKSVFDVSFKYSNFIDGAAANQQINFLSRQRLSHPGRFAGLEIIMHERIDADYRRAWIRYPGAKRFRRAPAVGYDTPMTMNRGLTVADQQDMFNGPLDRYNWTLQGRREMYMPYNTARLNSPTTRYQDLTRARFVNPDYLRYELRRVWVVEGQLKERASHAIQRRVFYIDEDSWSILAADIYSTTGELWRMQEAYLVTYPYLAASYSSGAYYDLDLGTYVLQGVFSEEPGFAFDQGFADSHFDADSIVVADDGVSWWRRWFFQVVSLLE